jgi:predicted Rossmann fold flavoprotein
MNKTDFDVAVIGGGAGGLAASICSAQRGFKTALVEGNSRVGKKLIVTGNGQGNIANANLSPDCYNDSFAMKVFEKIPLEALLEFFNSAGIETMQKSDGRIYPLGLQASAVLDNLRQKAFELGVSEICGCKINKLEKKDGVFILTSDSAVFTAKAVIAACGGGASPNLSCGAGYQLLTAFGHKMTKLLPSLVQIKTDKSMIKGLKGVKLYDIIIGFNGKNYPGDLIFTDYGISGSAAFDASSDISRYIDLGGKAKITIDLLPDIKQKDLTQMLLRRKKLFFQRSAYSLLTGITAKQMINNIMSACLIDRDIFIKDISDEKIESIAAVIKQYKLEVTGTLSLNEAQVTIGGIEVEDFNDNLMSKKCNDLYACGEMLNIDGKCGGYNLMWAFCSGILCGNSVLS